MALMKNLQISVLLQRVARPRADPDRKGRIIHDDGFIFSQGIEKQEACQGSWGHLKQQGWASERRDHGPGLI